MSERKDRPARLGRGLAALMGDETPVGTRSVSLLPVTALSPGRFQPRQDFAPEALEELCVSIRSHGVLQPILVRPSAEHAQSYEIIAGERRWRAAQMAGLHEVPVLVRDLDDRHAQASALIENLQRQDLNPIEEAEGLRRLSTDFAMTQEVLADTVGKSRSHVANMIRLLTLPTEVQFDVRRGALSAGHARALLSHRDPRQAAMTVLSRGLNVRQTEALSRPAEPRSVASEPDQANFELRTLERRLATHLGLAVSISFDGKGGQVKLRYRSVEQLEGLLTLLDPTRPT